MKMKIAILAATFLALVTIPASAGNAHPSGQTQGWKHQGTFTVTNNGSQPTGTHNKRNKRDKRQPRGSVTLLR